MTNFNKALLIIISYIPTIVSIIFAGISVYSNRHWGYCLGFIILAICIIPKISVNNNGEVKNFNLTSDNKKG